LKQRIAMRPINHKMLVLAREARGLSQADLALKLKNISQANYSRMEKGLITILEEQIEVIAGALDFPVSFFYRSEPLVTQTEFYYRKKASLLKKEQYALEANFSLIRLWFNDMLKEIDIPDFSLPEMEVEHNNTPEVIAQKTRMLLSVQRGPIGALINLLEKHGVIVYYLNNISGKFDGTTIITESGTRVIVVNAEMPNYRKRFTIAHELAHLICHIPFSTTVIESIRDVENEANRFAAEFLMPSNECEVDLFKLVYSKLPDIKNYWNVSKSAIIRRAYDLGCITKDKYTHLMIELSRYGERKVEKYDVPLDEPKLLNKILKSYYNDLDYSQEELMRYLTISADDFERFIFRKDNIRKLQISV
jgi:Zn-dependent peptidase ImmA (M78 family)/transcriptional regulator with XRE-family HTH domain